MVTFSSSVTVAHMSQEILEVHCNVKSRWVGLVRADIRILNFTKHQFLILCTDLKTINLHNAMYGTESSVPYNYNL